MVTSNISTPIETPRDRVEPKSLAVKFRSSGPVMATICYSFTRFSNARARAADGGVVVEGAAGNANGPNDLRGVRMNERDSAGEGDKRSAVEVGVQTVERA